MTNEVRPIRHRPDWQAWGIRARNPPHRREAQTFTVLSQSPPFRQEVLATSLTLEARQIGLALLVFLDDLIHCQKRSPGRSFFAEDRGKGTID